MTKQITELEVKAINATYNETYKKEDIEKIYQGKKENEWVEYVLNYIFADSDDYDEAISALIAKGKLTGRITIRLNNKTVTITPKFK